MKLLDPMARGLPSALAPLAAAGLRLRGRAEQADSPGPVALADAIARLLSQLREPQRQRSLRERVPAYISSEHSVERFHTALDPLIAVARKNQLGGPRSGANARQIPPMTRTRQPATDCDERLALGLIFRQFRECAIES